jgi:hypothetical protein
MALRRFRADLHIHSCLSPCGELAMSPRRIVKQALAEGLDIIALCDHNTAENAAAAIRAAAGTGLAVLPGMELTSEEEVHILGLFESMENLLRVQEEVFRKLPEVASKKKFIEDQVIVNEDDEVMGFSPHCLLAATQLDVYEIVELVHRHGGLAIASHIDREAFGLISQLGFIPPDLELDALEVSPRVTISGARAAGEAWAHLPLVRFSDAHRPEEIGKTTTGFLLASPLFGEIRLALKGMEGRGILES